MDEEKKEELLLSEEQVKTIQKAYQRPVAGVIIDTIIGFEKSLQVSEEAPVEEQEKVITEEPHTYAEYLSFYRAQEAKKKAEEEEEEEQPITA